MKAPTFLTEDELITRALEALTKALGPIETMRFLNLPRSQRIESIKRHRQWQATLEQEAFFDDVFNEPQN